MRGREQTCNDERGCGRLPPTVSRPRSRSLWLILSSVVWLLGAVPVAAASRPAAADAPDPATPWTLVVLGDRLTVQLDGVPLREVLAELARQATLHLTIDEAAGNERVSASFHDVPLVDGIDRLLGPHAYALLYAPTSPLDGESELKGIGELIVLAGQDPPADREEPRPTEPTQADGLGHPDPQVRIAALETRAQQGPEAAINALAQALVDPDEQVRARALELWEEALAGETR
jgi:HEAT repeat protein